MGWIRRMLGGGLTEDDVERMELARDVKGLIKCLEDGDMYIRFCAVMALGEIGDARAVEPLSKALGDEDWAVRLHAVEALGKIGDARAEEPLIKALRDEDWKVRRDAVKVLGSIGGENVVEAAVEPLVELLDDADVEDRTSAAVALYKLDYDLGKHRPRHQEEWDDIKQLAALM